MNYNKADFIASYGISSQLPESDRPELSFSGRSNVGKSSLINKLCSRKNLARVSIAGYFLRRIYMLNNGGKRN